MADKTHRLRAGLLPPSTAEAQQREVRCFLGEVFPTLKRCGSPPIWQELITLFWILNLAAGWGTDGLPRAFKQKEGLTHSLISDCTVSILTIARWRAGSFPLSRYRPGRSSQGRPAEQAVRNEAVTPFQSESFHTSPYRVPCTLSTSAGKTKKRLNLQGKTELGSKCESDFPQTIRPHLVLQSASFTGYILPFGMLNLSNILIQCSNPRVFHMEIKRLSKNDNTESIKTLKPNFCTSQIVLCA